VSPVGGSVLIDMDGKPPESQRPRQPAIRSGMRTAALSLRDPPVRSHEARLGGVEMGGLSGGTLENRISSDYHRELVQFACRRSGGTHP